MPKIMYVSYIISSQISSSRQKKLVAKKKKQITDTQLTVFDSKMTNDTRSNERNDAFFYLNL